MLMKSYLIPKREGQMLSTAIWSDHTSEEHKWELWDGIAFFKDGIERDRLAVCLVYNMGLEHFVHLLPEESKAVLKDLLALDK